MRSRCETQVAAAHDDDSRRRQLPTTARRRRTSGLCRRSSGDDGHRNVDRRFRHRWSRHRRRRRRRPMKTGADRRSVRRRAAVETAALGDRKWTAVVGRRVSRSRCSSDSTARSRARRRTGTLKYRNWRTHSSVRTRRADDVPAEGSPVREAKDTLQRSKPVHFKMASFHTNARSKEKHTHTHY